MQEKEILTSGSPASFSETGSPTLLPFSGGVGGGMVPQVMGMGVNMSLGGTFGGGGNGSCGDVTGKKKRGRPRKYDSDGNLRVSYKSPPPGFLLSPHSSDLSAKKGRGRPPSSGNWQLLASLGEITNQASNLAFKRLT